MDERAMNMAQTFPLVLTLPLCFAGGLLLGFAYFRALHWTTTLIVNGGSPVLALSLSLGRLIMIGVGFYLAVLLGGLALLAALAGVLTMKAMILRHDRGKQP
jgi:F1F0 ATPase subunit 2